ncbi:MAG: AAA family ATPase [Armatimonadetes bacterium]|nr:AAA family ATPase [Armatimonadota bacterium]
MYQSFSIRNFRCFQDMSLPTLKRVNLIAGMNNVGKTALLEALFLSMGPHNAELPLRIHMMRGFEQFIIDPNEIWGWLFHNKNTESDILSRGTDNTRRSGSLRITLENPTSIDLPLGRSAAEPAGAAGALSTASGAVRKLLLEYHDATGQDHISQAFVTSDGTLKFEGARFSYDAVVFFLTAKSRTKEDPQWFSKLEEVGRQDELVRTLRLLDPRLSRLAIF